MTFDQFLEKFPGLKTGRGHKRMVLCPCHHDTTPSLSVTFKYPRILIHCHANCDPEAICQALGLRLADLFVEPKRLSESRSPRRMSSQQRKPARFDLDLAELNRMQAALLESAEGLSFLKRRGVEVEVAKKLAWGYVANRRFDGDKTRPALAIPHIVNGRILGVKFRTIDDPGEYVQISGSSTDGFYGVGCIDFSRSEICVVEGPIDCGLLLSYHINAVAINSASAKVLQSDIELLSKFRHVFLLGDQDPPGQKAMDEIQVRLSRVKTFRPRLPGYKDVGELFGHRPQAFHTAIRNLLVLGRASTLAFELTDLLTETEIQAMGNDISRFVVESLIPANGITMLYSREKSGKSMLAFYIGKCVANGEKVFGKYLTTQAPVIYIDMENNTFDQQNFIELFKRVGPEELRYITRETGHPLLDNSALVDCCRKHKPLLIVDSLTKFLGSANGFDPKDMSPLMDKLLNLCASGATIILIHHAIKKDSSEYALSYAIGADVSRAYNIVSKNRPRLARVLMEAELCRGAEPQSLVLEAFPAITEFAMFRVTEEKIPGEDDGAYRMKEIVDFVASQPEHRCKRDDVMRKFGGNRTRMIRCIDSAVDQRLLLQTKHGNAKILSVPDTKSSPPAGTQT
jgi:archaellum biogenesis ATPase FlaH